MIAGILPMLLILAFGGGIVMAGKFCKTPVTRFFVGILLGFGFIFVLLGVAFAGCLLVLGTQNFH
jgi:hypothetical protein